MRPIPTDRSFYAEDAYGEIAHVEWVATDAPFGPYVGVLNSDGETFPVSDIRDWDDDRDALAARIEASFIAASSTEA